ncbi:MAG: hypothetical protein ABJC74_10350 [Gemmatimonadota bacterium]
MQSLIWLLAAGGIMPRQTLMVPPPDSSITACSCGATVAASDPIFRAGPLMPQGFSGYAAVLPDTAPPGRPHAFEYSHAYQVRNDIHRWASYATLPLFAAEYYLGQKLYNADSASLRNMRGTRSAHSAVALGVAGLFGVNTITGVWNLWEGRKDPNGRTRRFIHSGLMILSDAGFVATGSSAPDDHEGRGGNNAGAGTHRALAIASISTAMAGYLMMLIWK